MRQVYALCLIDLTGSSNKEAVTWTRALATNTTRPISTFVTLRMARDASSLITSSVSLKQETSETKMFESSAWLIRSA